MPEVEAHGSGVTRAKLDEARREIEALQRYTSEPLLSARLTIRHTDQARPFVADADVVMNGRLLAAHASGRSVDEAVELVTDRLREQIIRASKRLDDSEPASPPLDFVRLHQPERNLKPPEERNIVHRRTYLNVPIATIEALRELYDLDLHFFLFTHARTNEDVVVQRRDDRRPGLIHPRGSTLADEFDLVVTQESWFSEPLTAELARTEMDFTNHRFLYYIAAEDGRGRVLYLRHDGDYGLVEPKLA